jgi:hypothetical protein
MELSILLGPLVAMGASALLFLFASVVPWGAREDRVTRGVNIAAPAILLAAALAGWSLAGLPWSMTPRQAFAWLPMMLVLAAGASVAAEIMNKTQAVAAALGAVLFFASLNAGVGRSWDLATIGAWLAASMTLTALSAHGAARLCARRDGGLVALGIITALGAALVLATGNEQQSRTPALLAAALGGAYVLGLVFRRDVLGAGAGVLWAGVMQCVLTQASTLGETRWYAGVLVMLAPLAAACEPLSDHVPRAWVRAAVKTAVGVGVMLAAFLVSIPQIRGGA